MACDRRRQKDWNIDVSCDSFVSDSTSSAGAGGDFLCKGQKTKAVIIDGPETRSTCSPMSSSTTSSSLSQIPFKVFDSECLLLGPQIREPPDLCYEVNIAKSILQQYSTLSGNNLFDHLSDIIKRVLDERPPNVIDFFEEFSRNVREQKFHLPERFPPSAIFEETRMYKIAKKQLRSMRLTYDQDPEQTCHLEDLGLEEAKSEESLQNLQIVIPRRFFNVYSEKVQQLQFYWNQCGYSISHDDIFLLAVSIDRLQTHPSILGCRFWGVINGLKASYYIVEALLTKEQIRKRLEQMEDELREKFQIQLHRECCTPELPPHIGPELTPGFYGWEKYPEEELRKMQPKADPIPLPRMEEIYDIPPEMIGSGLNRFSYFVVNSLSDDWFELPIVTPKQIVVSRQMKKFFTGDMEAEICSYPCFPGKEKHYLRSMIARITCGTTIAPRGYYRKMTKHERRIYEGEDDDEMEEEEEEDEPVDNDDEEGEGEDIEEIDNDILPLRNEKYTAKPLENLTQSCKWVHVRPYILKQGRIVWFDEERARRERLKELARLRKLLLAEEMAEEEEEEENDNNADDDEELGEEEESFEDRQEYGPHILSVCNSDASDEFTVPWVSRFTSHFINKSERVLVMRSNVWPGSYSFTFGKVCETIYMGWGQKYVSRNMAFHHLPTLVDEYPHSVDDFVEATDPSVAIEEAYLKRKAKRAQECVDFETMGEDDEDAEDEY